MRGARRLRDELEGELPSTSTLVDFDGGEQSGEEAELQSESTLIGADAVSDELSSVGTLVLVSNSAELFAAHQSQAPPQPPGAAAVLPRPPSKPPRVPVQRKRPAGGVRHKQRSGSEPTPTAAKGKNRPVSAPSDFNCSLDQASLCSVKTAAASLRNKPRPSSSSAVLIRKLPAIIK